MRRTIQNGIDRLSDILPTISGARIGLITNPTGIDKNFRSTIDLLHDQGLLKCLFSPEHGVRGDLQAGAEVSFYTDSKTNLPVYSLYGSSPHISAELLQSLDVVAFDIQDVGARFYTYLYTLSYAMQDCAKAGKDVLLFDRINPVGAVKPEGTVLDPAFSSFVGRFPLATRYNLTIGEYARYINDTQHIGCRLTVINAEGWERSCFYDETDLPWIAPSPNLPSIDSCLCYIGTCLAEGTNLSEGRGTTRPFEIIGAPWLDADRVSAQINEQKLPGVKLRPCYFTPMFSKHANALCHGIQFHITDRHTFRPFETALRTYDLIRKTHTEFSFLPPLKENGKPFIDLLLGTDAFRDENFDPDGFLKEQAKRLAEYEASITPYYQYGKLLKDNLD